MYGLGTISQIQLLSHSDVTGTPRDPLPVNADNIELDEQMD